MVLTFKKIVIVLTAAFLLQEPAASCMQSDATSLQPLQSTKGQTQHHTGPSTTKLIGALGLGLAESYSAAYLSWMVTTPLEALFPGASYVIPGLVALGSYGLQKLAEHKVKLLHIQTAKPSGFWSHVQSWFSSAKSFATQTLIAHGLSSSISQLYQGSGSVAATTCNALAPQHPQACSWVADKAATALLTTASVLTTRGVEHLVSHDEQQLRVPKSTLMPPPCDTPQECEPQCSCSCSPTPAAPSGGIALEGPQVCYFLASNGCDIEKLWHRWLSQTAHVKAIGHGSWQKFCATHLGRLRASITHAFAAASKKLSPTLTTSITDLVHPHMPFGQYPQQFKLDATYLVQEAASFATTVDKEPQAIFDGIQAAILSYFNPENLHSRNVKGDEAVFNCPLTPVFIQLVDATHITITAYPQSRQDLLYPHQWETAVKLPRWFRVVSATIPYAIMAGQIMLSKPSAYFTPDGTMCAAHDGTMQCTDGTVFSTTCSSTTSCVRELLEKRLTPQNALATLELNPQAVHTAQEIKKQYKKLALRHHPDRCTPEAKKECEERFEKIAQAYAYLRSLYTPAVHAATHEPMQHQDIPSSVCLALTEK